MASRLAFPAPMTFATFLFVDLRWVRLPLTLVKMFLAPWNYYLLLIVFMLPKKIKF